MTFQTPLGPWDPALRGVWEAKNFQSALKTEIGIFYHIETTTMLRVIFVVETDLEG